MIKTKDCPVPILQNEWEFDTFLSLYSTKAPETIVEIGSFFGGTLWSWIKANKKLKKLTSVDYLIGPSDGRYDEMLKARSNWPAWTKDLEFYEILGDSHSSKTIKKVLEKNERETVDMLFIDGDHTMDGVLADFVNYGSVVKPGGWIVFHDSVGIPDVKKALEAIKSMNHYHSIEIYEKGGWGLTILER